MIWPTVALTGHRRTGSPVWVADELHRVLAKLTGTYGTTVAISGLALGADTLWAQAALNAGLELWAYSPGTWQANSWAPSDRQVRVELLNRASRVVELAGPYTVNALFERNRLMVQAADAVVAVYQPGRTGGTAWTFEHAKKTGKSVIHIDPDRRQTYLIGAAR